VGASQRHDIGGWRRFATITYESEPTTTDGRSIINILAPGKDVDVPVINANNQADYAPESGTSYAVPHVTAAVALLQQYAQWVWGRTIAPMAMKAVLMNSADKIRDRGDGLFLDMEKTATQRPGFGYWWDSPAFRRPEIPLDADLGTGLLNVR